MNGLAKERLRRWAFELEAYDAPRARILVVVPLRPDAGVLLKVENDQESYRLKSA
jgi:hypothetical protein